MISGNGRESAELSGKETEFEVDSDICASFLGASRPWLLTTAQGLYHSVRSTVTRFEEECLQHWRVRFALDEAALSLVAEPLLAVHDLLASQKHCRRPALDLAALEQVVIDVHVVRCGAHGFAVLRVPDYNIRVRANRER